MVKMGLYQITQELEILQSQIEEAGGEITEETAKLYFEKSDDFDASVLDITKWIKEQEANERVAGEESKRLRDRAKSFGDKADRWRKFTSFYMLLFKKEKIKSPEFSISARMGQPKLIITDEASIPKEFWIQPPPPPPELNREALKEALLKGLAIAGAELKTETILTIR